jgi:CheY-like chemotaxis protein
MLNIECRRETSDGAELYFQVIDTGVGIDREFQSIIFEKSDQSRDHTLTRYYGSRPGLAASRQVVEQLGGAIGLTSTKGKGSTFYFGLTLPLELSKPSADILEQAKAFCDPHASNIVDASVLLADDNKISQKVVASMLRKAGCKVDAVDNGKEVLSQILKKHYDVILMDCQMPVMDGYESTAGIRAMPEPYRSLPIIALTAHSLKHELQACGNCGMDDHLVKPVDRQKLVESVRKYAQISRDKCIPAYQAAS